MPDHVIDLFSDDEDIPQPFSESHVGGVSSGINSSSAQDFGSDYEGDPFNKRYVVDVIDGISIYQFESEVEMEYHANHENLPKRDELFLGFDIIDQPSKVLIEFYDKCRTSHFIPSDTKSVRAATGTPPLCSTESSVSENVVREEDAVPLPIPLCRNCGRIFKAEFPSIPEVICLDSDEEEDKADKKPEVADETPSKTFETSGERSFLVENEHCIQSSDHSYAVTQNEGNLPKFSKKNKNDLNTISTSVTSFISDEIICLDSDDDVSPVKVTSTKNRSNKKHMNYFTSESTTTPTLNAPTSLKTVKIKETIGCLGNDDIRSNTSVHSERSSEIQTDLSSASYSCTLFDKDDEIICLDDDSDSRYPVEMNTMNAPNNSTLNPGYEKCIDHLPEAVCKSGATLFSVSEVPHKETMSVSRPKAGVQSDATVYSKIPFQDDEIICLDDDSDSRYPVEMNTMNASSNSTLNPGYEKCIDHLPEAVCKSEATLFSVSEVPHKETMSVSRPKGSVQSDATVYSKIPFQDDEIICLDDDNDSRYPVEVNTMNASSNSTLNPGYEKCIDHLPEAVCKSETTLFSVSEVPHKETMSVSRPKGSVQSDATVYSKIPFQDDEIICLDDENDSRYPVEVNTMNASSNSTLNPGYEKCIDHLPEAVCKSETTLFSVSEVPHKETMSVSRPKGSVQSDATVYSKIPFQDDEIICLDDDSDSRYPVEINTMNTSSNSTLNPGYEKCIDHLPEAVCKSETTLFSVSEVPHKETMSFSRPKGSVQSDATVYSKIPFQDDEIICLDDDNDSRYPVEVNTMNASSNSTLNPGYEKCIDHLPEAVCKSETTLFSVSEVTHKEAMSVSRPKGSVQSDATVYSKIPFQDDEIICLDDDSDSRYPVEINTMNTSSNSTLNPGYEKCIDHLPEAVCKSETTLFSVIEVPHKEIMSVPRPKGNVPCDATVYSKFSDELLSTTSLFAASSVDDNTGHAGSLRVSNTKTVSDFTLGLGFHQNINHEPKVMCNFVALPSGIPNDPASQTLNLSELEDIEGLMQDAVSFVCRQEEIANIPVLLEPYDENYSANSSLGYQNLPPCSKEYCTMGCVCYCIRRKFKRNRCENQNCIFGCICYNYLKPRRTVGQRFHAKYEVTFSASSQWIPPLKHRDDSFESNNNENKSAGVNASLRQENKYIIPSKRSRRKQPLTHKEVSSQDCIVLKPKRTKYDVATQPIKTTSVPLVRQIVQQSLLNSNSHFLKKKFRSDPFIFQKSLKNNTMFLKLPFSTTQDFKKSPVQTHQQGSDSQHTSPTTTSTRPSSWTDGPLPAFALTCMTPGIGYIAVEEFGPSILKVCDPFDPSCSRHFTSVSLATDWLNFILRENLEFEDGVELKWFMANSIMLQRKKIKRFDRNVLLDPRCRITKNGVLFV